MGQGARNDLPWPRLGSKSVTTRGVEKYRLMLERRGKSPVQIMIKAMVDVYDELGATAAFPLAEKVAPYMYARLANIDITQEIKETKEFVISAGPMMDREKWLQIFSDRAHEAIEDEKPAQITDGIGEGG